MKKYIFLNVPFHGHINPTLPIIKELVTQGAEIIYYATDEFKDSIQATGACFRPYQSALRHNPESLVWFSLSKTPMINECYFVIPQLLGAIRMEQPCTIVYDASCLFGRMLAQILKIPAIKIYGTFPQNEHFHPFDTYSPGNPLPGDTKDLSPEIRSDVIKVCNTFHIDPFDTLSSYYWHAEPLNIVFLPQNFHPAGMTFDERFLFVGSSLAPRDEPDNFPLQKLSNQPLLYISMGSIHSELPPLYDICLNAFSNQPWQVVISIGKKVNPDMFGPLAKNILMRPYVPQLTVLERTDIFITHGGTNSVMEALYYGVPMIVIPVTHEHSIIGRRVEELRLGITLHGTRMITAHMLRGALRRVTDNPQLRARVQAMCTTVLEAGGYQRAADAIIRHRLT